MAGLAISPQLFGGTTSAQTIPGKAANHEAPTSAQRAKDILRNGLKEKLTRGELAVSMSVRLVRSPEIAQLASACGFDSFYIEMQHSSFTVAEISAICQAALLVGITPLVRVPSIAPEYVGRVLDGGALGIIAPEIQSAEEVRNLVAAAKLPPAGDRSAPGGQLFQLRYRSYPTVEAYEAQNDATMVVVMIENLNALKNVEEIAAVKGLDMLFVGVSDLSNSMGIPGQPDHPRVRDAYARVIAAAQRNGKYVGIGGLSSRPELVPQYVQMGARFISAGTDLAFLMEGASGRAKRNREVRF